MASRTFPPGTASSFCTQRWVTVLTYLLLVAFAHCSQITVRIEHLPKDVTRARSHDGPTTRYTANQEWLHAGTEQAHIPGEGHVGMVLPPQTDRTSLRDIPLNALEELHYALETMQSHYFELWVGTWPDAIDWTAAVMGTFVSASLYSLTKSLEYVLPSDALQVEAQRVENEINKYFSQAVAYYFGQNAFSIRLQAYDDMLWVVLGWLESIKFIRLHTSSHYTRSGTAWYGRQFEASFAHRAHVFYDIASRGWDTSLCGGGMTWNPHLKPYKNAITNELFISASVGMYLYFPGDDNASPFQINDECEEASSSGRPFDAKYLRAAIDGYEWLRNSNMTNKQGLYVDGFHIHGWGRNGSTGTGKCDVRNEMVYTYNQGVLLSGLRGLWESTGRRSYLEDGHELVRNVIAATGWDLDALGHRKRWAGLGRRGILEEICDASGTCSQDGQTFKGIFFHHLTLFCEPLPRVPLVPGKTHYASPEVAMLHAQSCKEYAPWVAHNARAALKTRNADGEFGMWWGSGTHRDTVGAEAPLPKGAVDYRNNGTVPSDLWGGHSHVLGLDGRPSRHESNERLHKDPAASRDPNDRGRGRTLETQGGGVAVLRAMWELVNMYRND